MRPGVPLDGLLVTIALPVVMSAPPDLAGIARAVPPISLVRHALPRVQIVLTTKKCAATAASPQARCRRPQMFVHPVMCGIRTRHHVLHHQPATWVARQEIWYVLRMRQVVILATQTAHAAWNLLKLQESIVLCQSTAVLARAACQSQRLRSVTRPSATTGPALSRAPLGKRSAASGTARKAPDASRIGRGSSERR